MAMEAWGAVLKDAVVQMALASERAWGHSA